MNSSNPRGFLLFVVFALLAFDASAQAVGRVLVVVGEVVVTRANRDVALTAGSAIERFDVIRTGEASSAQLRFSDETIVAMRAKSRFHVSSYRYTGSDDGVSEIGFALLRGGIRTLTGLIGKTRPERYRMATPLATVGIRGTAYSLVLCQKDCTDDDGTTAPDGAYGLVFEGRVAVANNAGEREFAIDEAFFVADASTPPQRLHSRPGFLRDRRVGRARREERREQIEAKAQAIAAQREQIARALGTAAESRITASDVRPVAVLGTAASPIVVADLKDASGNVALLGAGLGAGVSFATSRESVAIVDGGRGTVIQLDAQRGFLDKFSFNGGAQSGDRQNALVVDNGRLDADGGAVWGRWTSSATVQVGGLSGAPPTGVHFFFGNLTPESLFSAVPATASAVRFDYVGGTHPTDGQGNPGQFLSGNFIVNFLNRTIAGKIDYSVGPVEYVLPVPAGTAITIGRGFAGFNVNATNAGSWACSCNNTSGALDSYSVAGLFLGSRAQGLGVTFATDDARVGRTAGVALFRCTSGGCR
jgi:hypothetical protein